MPISITRLMSTLETMWQFGATPGGGVHRLALTPEDGMARDQLAAWFAEAGLEVRVDDVGNQIGTRAGTEDLPPVIIGSHTDTVPFGGRYDGILGVLAGLEVLRTLNDGGIETRAPIAVVNWTAEEGSRFLPPLFGSTVALGFGDAETALKAEDADGIAFGDALDRIGYRGMAEHRPTQASAYLELHIEQGPVLEGVGAPVGVVQGIIGQTWRFVTVTGRAGHAGASPMTGRADALVAAAAMVMRVRDLALAQPGYSVATVGKMTVQPGAMNVIPDRVEFTIDIRCADAADLAAVCSGVEEAGREIEQTEGVHVTISGDDNAETIAFNAGVMDVIRQAMVAEGLPVQELWSGAGHDAHPAALRWPGGMIFVRSKDGLSHAEAEYSSPEDIKAATNVLLRSAVALANDPSGREYKSRHRV